jgi:hypothetical protein
MNCESSIHSPEKSVYIDLPDLRLTPLRSFSLLLAFLIVFAGGIGFGAASPGVDDFEKAAHQPIYLALKGSETVRIVRTTLQAPPNRALQDLLSGHSGDIDPAALETADRCRQFASRSSASIGGHDVSCIAHAIASARAPPHRALPAA